MTGGPRFPDFLIVGAAKCGTTSLASWLAAHPDVHVAPGKELAYFSEDHRFGWGSEWYAAQFAGADGARVAGEATPNYMFYPWAVERIAGLIPDARLIVCLRNPTDRAYSHYLHWRDRLMVERRSFARAVDDELAAGGSEVAAHDIDLRRPYFAYVARGRYLEQLERLIGRFGRERLHIVLLDDMKLDPGASYAAVCRFLGVDAEFVPPGLGAGENRYQRHRNARLMWPLRRAHAFRRMPAPASRWLLRTVFALTERPVPEPDPVARARLVEFFAPLNTALGEWLGRDLASWNR